MTEDRDNADRRQARQASLVILVAMILWMLASWAGGLLGLPIRYAFLADFACLGALTWAGIVLFGVWRRRTDRN